MHKIKIIGPKYLVAPLALLGLEIHAADSEAEAKTALDSIASKKEPALIFITERLAVDLQEEIDKLNEKAGLTVAMIPDNLGSSGLAAANIKKLVKNSIGADVIGRK
ncbi:hypothetical protein A2291_01765 [candidate division WOR-1 bacterium RIFOXYB2_FULL_42_35]|uniref:V-type ATP synthase subunit F n=1 Tax=candidate division WOR-1 bacterium RIFOXYC2_FULL_41_25 TaxID=1802586 RepID=A0A1F4TQC7_UNCSA|nr:MAG: hypothetical protein A2247_03565 [candidate division WOR-1 bacterium RIFOXYA2_FULL_41_14]OGC25472.1 MAG: hypothetical protein A2291_01765 [candidate division WOR-1 bacterium RIFOXYB2_FULL_42_35]OGC34878.1 MAG: hypothetical protein A2462_05700 [candidate division WOR-1 bacterium RIFOXYC2_FULL_41_25]OGC42131.1 MAG: hypothetical protein A2548_01995 [candidate division WOR-1 bacterium RIFOXYD2_FULL_41_8]